MAKDVDVGGYTLTHVGKCYYEVYVALEEYNLFMQVMQRYAAGYTIVCAATGDDLVTEVLIKKTVTHQTV